MQLRKLTTGKKLMESKSKKRKYVEKRMKQKKNNNNKGMEGKEKLAPAKTP